MESIFADQELANELEAAGHRRRRAAWKEMQAENDLEASKAAMARSEKIKPANVDPGKTSEIRLNIAD